MNYQLKQKLNEGSHLHTTHCLLQYASRAQNSVEPKLAYNKVLQKRKKYVLSFTKNKKGIE
jgi:hypothetical protein